MIVCSQLKTWRQRDNGHVERDIKTRRKACVATIIGKGEAPTQSNGGLDHLIVVGTGRYADCFGFSKNSEQGQKQEWSKCTVSW